MSDTVLTAMIGVAGSAVGAVATIVVARIQTAQKDARAALADDAGTKQVLGKVVDIRELRILRALFGEPKGRLLEGYLSKYYQSSRQAALDKGWMKQIEGRYYMTRAGAAVCRDYLQELAGWQPDARLLG